MKRIASIDAMRGFAMVLVITQHGFHLVNPQLAQSTLGVGIYTITKMASVAFMVVSGAMLGFFASRTSDHDKLLSRYLRRAVVVLLAGHLLIPLVRIFYYPDPLNRFLHNLATDFPITDTIAFCLVVGLFLILRLGVKARVILALGLLVAAPIVQLLWRPSDAVPMILKHVLFGAPFEASGISFPWPLLSWLGIFLIGTVAGQAIAGLQSGADSINSMSKKFFKVAISLFALGVALSVLYKVVRVFGSQAIPGEVFTVFYPNRATLLLPAYLGLLLAALALIMQSVKAWGGAFLPVWVLTVFGRTSLFTYITQFVFVHTIPAMVGLKGELSLLGYVLLTTLALPASWFTSYLYGRMRGKIDHADRGLYRSSQA